MFLRVGLVTAAWISAAVVFGEPALGPSYEVRTSVLFQRYQLVTPSEFNLQAIKHRAINDLVTLHHQDTASKLRFIRISYFTDSQDLERTAAGKGTDNLTFDYWKLLYEKHGSSALPAADLVEINHHAVLRYWSGKESFTKSLSQGDSSPLEVVSKDHGGKYEILELAVDKDGSLRCYAKFIPAPVEMGPSHAGVLALALSNELGIPNVRVFLRRDSWFILQPDFPIAYRFEPSSPPGKEDFEKSVTYDKTAEAARKEYDAVHKGHK